jgi:hypothetical protein
MLSATDCLQSCLITSFGRTRQEAKVISARALRDRAYSLINTSAKRIHRRERQASAQKNDTGVTVSCYLVLSNWSGKM